MSRHLLTRRPVRAVLALTVGGASLVGLGQASAAPPVTYAVTGVSPAYVEAGRADAFGITLTGKGFTRHTVVSFANCASDGTAVTARGIAPTTPTATKLVVRPPACTPGVKDITITEGTPAPTSTLLRKLTFLATPAIEVPASPALTVTPATGAWTGGTLASPRMTADLPPKAAVQVRFTTDGVTKAVAAKADTTDLRKISFKVPPGLPGGRPDIAVSVFGIVSAAEQAQFRYVSTIKTSPAVWVKGAAAPTLKIDGAGFTAASTVTVCGQPAAAAEGKTPTAKTLFVMPPAWNAAGSTVDAEHGGVCTVRVDADGPGTTGEVSAITAGSTFTYAAH